MATRKAAAASAFLRIIPEIDGFEGGIEDAIKGAQDKIKEPVSDSFEEGTAAGIEKGGEKGTSSSGWKTAMAAGAAILTLAVVKGIGDAAERQDTGNAMQAMMGLDDAGRAEVDAALTLMNRSVNASTDEMSSALLAVYKPGMAAEEMAQQARLLIATAQVTASGIEETYMSSKNFSEAFGVDMATAYDAIVTMSQQGGTIFREQGLGALIEFSSDLARITGGDIPEAMRIMTVAAESGFKDINTPLDLFQEATTKAKDGSIAASEEIQAAFAAVGIDWQDYIFQVSNSTAEGFQMVMDIAGQAAAGDGVLTAAFGGGIAEDSRDEFERFAEAIKDTTATAEDFTGAAQEASDVVQEGWNYSLSMLNGSIQELMLQSLGPLIEAVSPVIIAFAEWINTHGPIAQGMGMVVLAAGFLIPQLATMTAAYWNLAAAKAASAAAGGGIGGGAGKVATKAATGLGIGKIAAIGGVAGAAGYGAYKGFTMDSDGIPGSDWLNAANNLFGGNGTQTNDVGRYKDSWNSLFGAAEGGIFSGPTPTLIGENGYKEAVIPLESGRLEALGLNVRNGDQGNSDGNTVNISVVVNEANKMNIKELSREIARNAELMMRKM